MLMTTYKFANDEDIIKDFRDNGYWGFECLINLKACDKMLISNKDELKDFITELCHIIDMEPVYEPILERFGSGQLYGYSLMQLIRTSSIIGHFAEESGDAYIDIFSCKEFYPSIASEFCRDYFEADEVEYITILRDARV